MSAGATLIAAILAGPCIGSFAATAMERHAAGQAWIAGRSRCDGCQAPLPARALIPILSYAGQRGRARCCRCVIEPGCTLVELACLVVPLSAWAAGLLSAGAAAFLVACCLGWTLVALSVADFREGRLPDAMTLPLTLSGLAWVAGSGGDIAGHAGAALLGYAIIYGPNRVYRAARGRDGLGMGDAKLLMAAGAWCGMAGLPGIVLIGCLATLGGAILVSARDGLTGETALPLGPGLALGAWMSFLAGPFFWGGAPW